MEYALLHKIMNDNANNAAGLNPCSNEICSLTAKVFDAQKPVYLVLILVLMEYALLQVSQLI